MSGVSFDSNILIDALNGNAAAQDELERASDRWISRVTWIEVMSKVNDTTLRPTELLLSAFDVDELTPEIGRRAATLRNARRKLLLPDAVILASAQLGGRVLVTRNSKDFPPDMPGIHVPYTLQR